MKNMMITLVKTLYAMESLNYNIRLKISKASKDTDVLKLMAKEEKRREVCDAIAENENSDGGTLDELYGNSYKTPWTNLLILGNPNIKTSTVLKLSMCDAKIVSDKAKAILVQSNEREDVTQ